MTSGMARRLERVETALTPTELVVRWLDEAHSHGSFVRYVASLLDGPAEAFPLNRLLREAAAGDRARQPGGEGREALRVALRETAFRFELVLAINTRLHDLVERELLHHVILTSQLALYLALGDDGQPGRLAPDHLAQTVRLADRRVTELLAHREACRSLEARYLDGHPAAFPDVVADFEDGLATAQHTLASALRLAELDEVATADLVAPARVAHRALELEANLVEPARSTALEKLGDGRAATRVATRWVRGTLERSAEGAPL